MKYPLHLKQNDLIGITAPSGVADISKLDLSINNIKNMGFGVVETDNVRKCIPEELVSSSAIQRVTQFIELWQKEDVRCIISASGGDFLMEMIPILAKHPKVFENNKNLKWFQGYSDNSILSFYITTTYNIATINGANIGEFAMKNFHQALKANFDLLTKGEIEFVQESFEKYQKVYDGRKPDSEYILTDEVMYKSLNFNGDKILKGRLIGGCLEAISNLVGTSYDCVAKFCKQFKEGMIWYLDIYDLDPIKLYQTLWQLNEATWFKNAKGFLIGRTYAAKEKDGFTYEMALKKAFGSSVPVIYDVDIGHVAPQWTLVNSANSIFEFSNGKGKLTQTLK
ncbi:MAG: LD-carboxypeptidase [Clostridia bacterium]